MTATTQCNNAPPTPGLHSGPNPLQTGQEVNTGLHFLRHPKSRECWERISEPPLLQHHHVIFFLFTFLSLTLKTVGCPLLLAANSANEAHMLRAGSLMSH